MSISMEALFWSLYNCNHEDEINRIISGNSLLNNLTNWKPYGNNIGNFGTFESQQNHPVPALVEKITNSIDAILIKECKLRGIDPSSDNAPITMKKAVELFYNVKDGEIGELDSKSRRSIAENIQILALGDKAEPSLVIYDNGEGQNPQDFENTFLSLHKNNKTNIHFVQGKYNMGSTGAVVFCGENKYQLIASKRNPELNGNNELGFTLVRRHPLTRDEELREKATWYEYFCPDYKIPSFRIQSIDIGLKNKLFTSGSIIKLYSYQLPKRSRSNITLDLWRDLNQYMFNLPLPIILFEKRDFKGNTPDKLLLGNRTRISIDDKNNIEKIIPFNIPNNSVVGEVDIEVILFKKNVDHAEYIKNKSIIYTLNGQVQGYEGQSFISNELGFSLLKKSLLIHVNCTKIPTSVRQDLFMSNRTQLKQGKHTENLREIIIERLKKSDDLRRINNERKNSIFQNSESDKETINDLISKLPIDKDVINLLRKDGNLDFLKKEGNKINKMNRNNLETQKRLNRFPSIFNFKHSKNGKMYKTIPINNSGVVQIETDVEDDYLFRPYEKGQFTIEVLQKRNLTNNPVNSINPDPDVTVDVITVEREGPSNGSIKLIIKPTDKATVGDEIDIKATLTSPGKDYSCIFTVKVDDNISKSQDKEIQKNETYPTLPTPRKAFEKPNGDNGVAWSELNWDGYDIVKITTDSDKNTNELLVDGIVVNMDAHVLKQFVSKNRIKTEESLKSISDKYFFSVYLNSLFLYSILQKISRNDERLKNIEIDEFVSSLMKPYTKFLLYENFHITEQIYDDY